MVLRERIIELIASCGYLPVKLLYYPFIETVNYVYFRRVCNDLEASGIIERLRVFGYTAYRLTMKGNKQYYDENPEAEKIVWNIVRADRVVKKAICQMLALRVGAVIGNTVDDCTKNATTYYDLPRLGSILSQMGKKELMGRSRISGVIVRPNGLFFLTHTGNVLIKCSAVDMQRGANVVKSVFGKQLPVYNVFIGKTDALISAIISGHKFGVNKINKPTQKNELTDGFPSHLNGRSLQSTAQSFYIAETESGVEQLRSVLEINRDSFYSNAKNFAAALPGITFNQSNPFVTQFLLPDHKLGSYVDLYNIQSLYAASKLPQIVIFTHKPMMPYISKALRTSLDAIYDIDECLSLNAGWTRDSLTGARPPLILPQNPCPRYNIDGREIDAAGEIIPYKTTQAHRAALNNAACNEGKYESEAESCEKRSADIALNNDENKADNGEERSIKVVVRQHTQK